MEDTREHKKTDGELAGEERRRYVRALLTDLRALERMEAEGAFERGVSRIGAEQELFLVDSAYHPAPGALEMLKRLGGGHFTTELGLFNLEMNADPQPLAGHGLRQMEAQLEALYERTRAAAAELGLQPVLAGILPSIGKSDLHLRNMVPNPRYLTLNRVMTEARGAAYDVSIRGVDELVVQHDSLMVEACNASFQVHLQLAEPERFAHHYNLAQLLLAPVLASGTNSAVLFGRRLWAETRIALFEQAVDIRTPGLHLRDAQGRVSFGTRWLRGGVADLFKDNVSRFRTLVGTDPGEDALAALDGGRVPELRALRLHNGTIYRWNRPCYGISESGKPHLRIELRVLPSGPTIADEVASAALWLGLMSELGATVDDLPARLDVDHARANLYAAAREGLGARFHWLDGEEVLAQPLLLERLLPLAAAGLARAGADAGDAARYLGIVEQRVRTLRSGSRWMIQSMAAMKDRGSAGARATALVAAMIARQKSGKVVSEWEKAQLVENDSARTGHHKVAQYMTTDLVTVRPDDPVELVADLMGWQRIRHVPVEDEAGRLVGLVSYGAVLRHMTALAKQPPTPGAQGASISAIMTKNLITVTPDALMLLAIHLMRKNRIGCLPVKQGDHLVAILTEEDLVGIAADVLEREETQPAAGDGSPGV
ncbi:MAG TPA: CBS domain-containing protein [Anaeromyxobacteraceae bacterium]|nr:CBS domain-containing protein [Anaeromyxobacteraceae bacterium]